MKRGDPINWFNPAKVLCLSQSMTWIPMSYVVGFLYVQGVKMRGDCTLC
jgi:hypothetical protein